MKLRRSQIGIAASTVTPLPWVVAPSRFFRWRGDIGFQQRPGELVLQTDFADQREVGEDLGEHRDVIVVETARRSGYESDQVALAQRGGGQAGGC